MAEQKETSWGISFTGFLPLHLTADFPASPPLGHIASRALLFGGTQLRQSYHTNLPAATKFSLALKIDDLHSEVEPFRDVHERAKIMIKKADFNAEKRKMELTPHHEGPS